MTNEMAQVAGIAAGVGVVGTFILNRFLNGKNGKKSCPERPKGEHCGKIANVEKSISDQKVSVTALNQKIDGIEKSVSDQKASVAVLDQKIDGLQELFETKLDAFGVRVDLQFSQMAKLIEQSDTSVTGKKKT